MDSFVPGAARSELFVIGGAGHAALALTAAALLALLILSRREAWRLRRNRSFMAGTATFVLAGELASSALQLVYPTERAWEIVPLHLCASLKIAVAALVLLERYDLIERVSVLAVGAGFISFANLNLNGAGPGSLLFWHYVWGHLYLLLVPVLLFLSGEFRYELRSHGRSMLGLFAWSLVVFCVNWAFDTNYMYTGPHNDTAVPFIPDRLMVWPLNYVSYVGVALVLLNAVYLVLRLGQARMDFAPARVEECSRESPARSSWSRSSCASS